MSKKKKRKETKKEKNNYSYELIGVLLILIALIGCVPNTGIAGSVIGSFAMFLVGCWYLIILIGLIVTGIYMIIKREKPEFFTSKLIGLYIIFIGILVLSHIKYIENPDLIGFQIIEETVNNFMSTTNRVNIGGGMIGAIFSALFTWLFSIKGTRIVTWGLIVCGIIMFTGMSIVDAVKAIASKIKTQRTKEKEKKDKKEIKAIEEHYENDNKKVISSVDDLIQKTPEETPVAEIKEEVKEVEEMDTKGYVYPSINLLNKPSKNKNSESKETINHNVDVLHQVFKDFGLEGRVVAINPGPAVTQYEMEIKSGTRLSKISSIHSEIALALAAKDVRIQAPIPGKSTIGIEIPNKVTSMVTVREILEQIPKSKADSKLMVTLGRDIMGRPQYCEINKTPHLLVAGSTGSGKSVCINSIIVSILMRAKPDEVKLVLVDPKKVELSMYNGVPHLLAPVVTDPKKANIALKKIVVEMEHRYDMFSNTSTKNIAGYNAYIDKKNESLPEEEKIRKLPYIVVIIDELADLMLVAAKEVEDSIMRITQMARAAGIHLIVATQRPSTDVITGVVKANIPSRISFAVSSSIDSRTILDMTGAEKLLGKGDMLFLPQGENTPIRIQGTFIDDDEIKRVVDYTIKQQIARYDETLLMDDEEMHATSMVDPKEKDATEEPLYNEIVEFVVTSGKASASLLQRRFRLGYNRAARAIDLLEERGIIGPSNGSKPREVLVKLEQKDE
ncbi:MAG: DNA translocase FtsK [Tenericutes bacterium]|nr:DNA translocase FtsK [Mycoplasmatota bacterium]